MNDGLAKTMVYGNGENNTIKHYYLHVKCKNKNCKTLKKCYQKQKCCSKR